MIRPDPLTQVLSTLLEDMALLAEAMQGIHDAGALRAAA